MKKILIILGILFLNIIGANNIYAAKVSDGKFTLLGSSHNISKLENYIDRDTSDVSEICAYMNSDTNSSYNANSSNNLTFDGNFKFLFIYKDGTSAISWHGGLCDRTILKSGMCIDGQDKNGTKYAGIKNWSKNSSGVESNLGDFDAYKVYADSGKCPQYIAQSVYGGANWFYVSAGNKTKDLNKIISKADKLSGTSYYYYNYGEENNLQDSVACSYSDSIDDDNAKFVLAISKDGYAKVDYFSANKSPFGPKTTLNINGNKIVYYDMYINSRFTSNSYLKLLESGKCPKSIDACVYKDAEWWVEGLKILLAGPLGAMSVGADLNISKIDIYGDQSILKKFCKKGESFTFSCVGENCSDDNICQAYGDYMSDMDEQLGVYNKSKLSSDLNIYNQLKDELNSYCASVLSNMNYNEGNCVSKCVKLNKEIATLEKDNNLRSDYDDSTKCGIGTSIISMVYNVLKWVKYILPALVIILTMLDFIKAIAAQNDDDMKKAQGKFVKRLIVAALLFLLPLIINFVLQTFGFYDQNCDITDLFKK